MSEGTQSTIKKNPITKNALWLLMILLPPTLIVSAGIAVREFVIAAVEANKLVNCGIIGSAALGVVLIVSRLISLQIDFRIIRRFGEEALAGVYMPELLRQPWLQGRYVRHYLSHIAETGGTLLSEMEQTAIEEELKHLAGDYNNRLVFCKFLVGFMISMGLLGTFAGFLEALTGISATLDAALNGSVSMDEKINQIIGGLRPALGGMGTAFSASMFGLICNQMLSFMMTVLNRYTSVVMALARNVMHELIQMRHQGAASNSGASGVSLSPDDIAGMIAAAEGGEPMALPAKKGDSFAPMIMGGVDSGRLEDAVRSIGEKIVSAIGGLGDRFSGQEQRLARLGDVLAESAEFTRGMLEEQHILSRDLVKNSQQLAMDSRATAHTFSNVLDEQRKERVALQLAFDQLSATLQKVEALNDASSTSLRGIDQKSFSISNTMTSLVSKYAAQEALLLRLSDHFSENADLSRTALTEQRALASEFIQYNSRIVADGGRAVRAFVGVVAEQKHMRKELLDALTKLGDVLLAMERNGQTSSGDVAAIRKDFTSLCQSMQVLEKLEFRLRAQDQR